MGVSIRGTGETGSPEENKKDNFAKPAARHVSPSLAAPHILVVDDDPIFGKIMGRIAQQSQVALTFCKSLEELGEVHWWRFNAAIVDYNLGDATGLDLIKQLERFLGDLPVIMVSQGYQVDTPLSQWPCSIKGFLHKGLGHFAILEAALAAYDVAAAEAATR